MARHFIHPIGIIHEHLPISFPEAYCGCAFIEAAWAQEIYFYRCNPKKGRSNEFLLGELECRAGILCKTCFAGRWDVKQWAFLKSRINLYIWNSLPNHKHSFGIVYSPSTLTCWCFLERRGKLWHGNFHFPCKGQVIPRVSNELTTGRVRAWAWPEQPRFCLHGDTEGQEDVY